MAHSTYRALLIGNSTFPMDPHNLLELEGPRNDPAILRDVLSDEQVGIFPADNIRVVAERTEAEIRREIHSFLSTASRRRHSTPLLQRSRAV